MNALVKKKKVFSNKIGRLPRVRLAHLPTPFQEMPNLSERIDGPKFYVKRDDLTGLAFGGNKTRKLEFIFGDAVDRGADVVIAGNLGFQSNFLTQTAAAARKLGMDVILLKIGPEDDYDPREYDGNHLLQSLLGADIHVSTRERAPKPEEIAEKLEKEGRKPYIILHAGSTPLGTAGYANAMLELVSQAMEKRLKIDYVVHATGSAGTQAGLVLAEKFLGSGIKVIGISVSEKGEATAKRVVELANDSARLLELDLSVDEKDVTVIEGYAREGYGVLNKGKMEAIKLVAQTEGVLLDPVYTGTAMAGLIDLARKKYFDKNDSVVFINTGGTPALFPYKEPIKSFIKSNEFVWTKPPWFATFF